MYKAEHKAEQGFEPDLQIEVIKKCKIGIVEIGVLDGNTTRIFLENTNIPVYGIDPIIPDSMNSNLIGNLNSIKTLQDEYFDRFIFIKDYSYNVVNNFNYKFDYLFIDADHRYESVKKDFLDWFPLLNSGGYISFHDSAAFRGGAYHWEGPSKFVDELLLNLDIYGLKYYKTLNSLTVLQKN
jgi:hypothetical protein